MKILMFISLLGLAKARNYTANWEDLDKRPLPMWYDQAKIGILIHWGVYSVPAYGPPSCNGAELILKHWKTGNRDIQYYMDTHYSTGVTYMDLAQNFTAEHFYPSEWAALFKRAGANYVILTSKHHDGFLLFPSKTSRWNSVEIGPHRDLIGELNNAVRAADLQFGIYYSLYEWFNRLYTRDKKNNFRTNDYVGKKVSLELDKLVNVYQPSVIWSDGDWYNTPDYWNSTEFLAWLYNESPQKDIVVVNDRWGQGTWGKHGDFYNVRDRYNPRAKQPHKWENVFGLDKRSWGYRHNMGVDLITIDELIENVVSTVSCGGNALINIGATADGKIPPEFQNLLESFGTWISVNGEAIYGTTPWIHTNEFHSKVWFTCKAKKYNEYDPLLTPWQPDITATYAIFLKWPKSGILKMKSIWSLVHSQDHDIKLLGYEGTVKWRIGSDAVHIQLPRQETLPSKFAWTLKLTKNLKGSS